MVTVNDLDQGIVCAVSAFVRCSFQRTLEIISPEWVMWGGKKVE